MPILDWFHIGMRLQHLKQTAAPLLSDVPARAAAKTVLVAEVGRLHWRLWNGKAKNARISIERIREVMHHFQGDARSKKAHCPVTEVVDCSTRARRVSQRPGRMVGQLCQTPSCWIARWSGHFRRDHQFSCERPIE
jgi:hypothetical protein